MADLRYFLMSNKLNLNRSAKFAIDFNCWDPAQSKVEVLRCIGLCLDNNAVFRHCESLADKMVDRLGKCRFLLFPASW